MNVYYDDEIDALYLELGNDTPDGVIEIAEGIHLDTSADGKLVGIEILQASSKMDIKTLYNYRLVSSKEFLDKKAA